MSPQSNFEFTSRFLTTRKFILHYMHKGVGDPVILLHGGGTWLYSFRHNIPELSRFFSVYAIDLPGHGYTEPLTTRESYNFDTICQSLLEFLDKMKIKKAHIVGHSWGGGWAVYFAAKHPMRVDKLILIDSSGLNHRERLVWELMKYPVVGKIMSLFLSKSTVKKGLENCYYDTSLVSDEMIEKIYTPLCRKHILRAQLSYSKNIDWKKTTAAFALLSSPTLIIWGENDHYIHVKFAKQIQRLIPGSQLKILDNCGHSVHEECPEIVNSLMIQFLKK